MYKNMTQVALHYTAAQIDAAIGKINRLIGQSPIRINSDGQIVLDIDSQTLVIQDGKLKVIGGGSSGDSNLFVGRIYRDEEAHVHVEDQDFNWNNLITAARAGKDLVIIIDRYWESDNFHQYEFYHAIESGPDEEGFFQFSSCYGDTKLVYSRQTESYSISRNFPVRKIRIGDETFGISNADGIFEFVAGDNITLTKKTTYPNGIIISAIGGGGNSNILKVEFEEVGPSDYSCNVTYGQLKDYLRQGYFVYGVWSDQNNDFDCYDLYQGTKNISRTSSFIFSNGRKQIILDSSNNITVKDANIYVMVDEGYYSNNSWNRISFNGNISLAISVYENGGIVIFRKKVKVWEDSTLSTFYYFYDFEVEHYSGEEDIFIFKRISSYNDTVAAKEAYFIEYVEIGFSNIPNYSNKNYPFNCIILDEGYFINNSWHRVRSSNLDYDLVKKVHESGGNIILRRREYASQSQSPADQIYDFELDHLDLDDNMFYFKYIHFKNDPSDTAYVEFGCLDSNSGLTYTKVNW